MYVQAGRPEVALYELLPLLQQRHAEDAAKVRAAMARGASGPYLLLADAAAKELGVNIGLDGWAMPEAKPLRDDCALLYSTALLIANRPRALTARTFVPSRSTTLRAHSLGIFLTASMVSWSESHTSTALNQGPSGAEITYTKDGGRRPWGGASGESRGNAALESFTFTIHEGTRQGAEGAHQRSTAEHIHRHKASDNIHQKPGCHCNGDCNDHDTPAQS